MFAKPTLYYCSKVVLHKIRAHFESGRYAFHSFKKIANIILANTTVASCYYAGFFLCGCINIWSTPVPILNFLQFPLQKLIVKSFLKTIKSLQSAFNHLIGLLWRWSWTKNGRWILYKTYESLIAPKIFMNHD